MQIRTDGTKIEKTNLTTVFRGLVLLLCIISMNYVQAGEADVVNTEISNTGGNVFRFDVTIRHADAGWDHYADRWDILDLDGNLLGSRLLAHPHDNEQPFTRSLTVKLPEGINRVIIRAHDSVHGLGGITVQMTLPDA